MRDKMRSWAICLLMGVPIGCGSDAEEMSVAGLEGPTDDDHSEGNHADAEDGEAHDSEASDSNTNDSDSTIGSPSMVAPDTMSHGADADGNFPDLRGRCEIDSGFPDDEACIPPPPEDEGFQIHIGPRDYDDPDQIEKFIMMPGDESSECWTFHTPNDEDVTYQTFVLSGRAGTHHIINTMFTDKVNATDGGFTACADPGVGRNPNIIDNLPGASKAYMERGHIAPENKNIGRHIAANTLSQADMHYFNAFDEPVLREFWMNIYYAKEDVTEQADQIRGMGGLSWTRTPIPPGTDEVYQYECPIVGDGRIIALLGHFHAQGRRFTAHIRRSNGDMDKVFEMYDYLDPATFEYNSIIENPSFGESTAGATSGILEVNDGDTLLWECHIENDLERGLTYTNNVVGGEMCNIWGESMGIKPLNCLIP